MSMCLCVWDDENIVISADSRMSVRNPNGGFYDTGMEVDKIRQVKGKMIFGNGTMALYHEICDRFENSEGSDIYTFQCIVKQVIKEFSDHFIEQGYRETDEEWEVIEYNSKVNLVVAGFEEGETAIYLLQYKNGYEIVKAGKDNDILVSAEDIPKTIEYIKELAESGEYEDIEDIILEVYNHFSGNFVGGTVSIYLIDQDNKATLVKQSKIKDSKEVLLVPPDFMYLRDTYIKHCEEVLKPYIWAGVGIFAEVALAGLGKVGRLIFDNISNGKFQKIPVEAATSLDNAANILKPTNINSKGMYKVKNTALKNAIDEYNGAIEIIQNHFKTNDLGTDEIVSIKTELGIDLNSIVKKIEAAEKGINLKDIGLKRNLANAAGVKNLPKINPPVLKPLNIPKTNIELKLEPKLKSIINEPNIDPPKLKQIKQRSLPKSIIDSDIAKLELKAGLKNTNFDYMTITNKETLENARKLIDIDYDKALKIIKEAPASAEGNAIGMELVNRLQGESRYTEAIDIIENISKKATESGQAIQALSMWGRLTPEGMLKYTQNIFDKANDELTKQGFKNIKKLKLTEEFAKDITERMVAIGKMEEGRAKKIEIAKVLRDIDEQLPKDIWRKVSTVQTMAQLLNTKTMVRNIAGNTIFSGLENVSNTIGTPIDKLVSKMTGQRTTILPSLKTQLKAGKVDLVEAVEDALIGIDTKGLGGKFELGTGRTFNRKTLLGKLETGLNIGLKATDAGFSGAARAESLRQQMKIAGVTEPTPGMIEIADHVAKYRTFQDSNGLSKGFKGIKDGLNRVSSFFTGTNEWGLGDLVIKYATTPSNILARGIDYSPVGAMKAVNEALKPLRGKVFNQKEFIDALSRATTGTGLIALGYQLNKMGLITGAPDKDRDVAALQRDIGKGEYRLNTTALNRYIQSYDEAELKAKAGDTYVSWDWAAPTSIMLGIGANISQNKGNSADLLTTLINATASGMNTIFEQPLLTGIKNFTGGYDQTQNLVNTLQTLPSSFTPSLLNQAKQLTDNTVRNTYDSSVGKETLNKAKARVPRLSKLLPPRINTLGKPKETYKDGSNTLYNVLLNPSNTSKYTPTPATEMVLDIYEKTGEKIHFPRVANTYIMYKGKRIDLTPEEVTKLQTLIGEKTAEIFDKFALNKGFRLQKPELQAKKLQTILTDINQNAKLQILRDILEKSR